MEDPRQAHKTTVATKEKTTTETCYYITSFGEQVGFFARCVRERWAIESLYWLLDVTFRKNVNKTLNQTATQNLNHPNKLALAMLKEIYFGKKMSCRRKNSTSP